MLIGSVVFQILHNQVVNLLPLLLHLHIVFFGPYELNSRLREFFVQSRCAT